MLWIMAWMALGLYVACVFGAAAAHMGKSEAKESSTQEQENSSLLA